MGKGRSNRKRLKKRNDKMNGGIGKESVSRNKETETCSRKET